MNQYLEKKRRYGLGFALLALLLTSGCTKIVHKPLIASADGTRTLAIFFDGTHNNASSDTNVKQLHSLMTLQSRSDISTLYIEGVGTGSDVLGMAFGLGNKPRVIIAYEFILDHYREGDRIFIFGFSRGAFSARILNSLLYHAGIVKSATLKNDDIAKKVYDAVKAHKKTLQYDESTRLKFVHAKLKTLGLSASTPVTVEMLGLWDTVEAFGMRDNISKLTHKLGIKKHEVNVDDANPRYGDKLCNVKEVRHALSIDDDREWIFTPRLMTRKYMFEGCDESYPIVMKKDKNLHKHLKEVWFSGAHSDVGGGYADSGLSGVSLNWMIGELKPFGLLPDNTRVLEDPYGTSHDPEGDGIFNLFYHAVNRDFAGYALQENTLKEFQGRLFVHSSVFKRRRIIAAKSNESEQFTFKHPGIICLVDDLSKDLSARGRYVERRENTQACKKKIKLIEYVRMPTKGKK